MEQPLIFKPSNNTDVRAIIYTPRLVDLIKASPFFKIDFADFQEEQLNAEALSALFFLYGQTFSLDKKLVFANVVGDKIRDQVLGVFIEFLSPPQFKSSKVSNQ